MVVGEECVCGEEGVREVPSGREDVFEAGQVSGGQSGGEGCFLLLLAAGAEGGSEDEDEADDLHYHVPFGKAMALLTHPC